MFVRQKTFQDSAFSSSTNQYMYNFASAIKEIYTYTHQTMILQRDSPIMHFDP